MHDGAATAVGIARPEPLLDAVPALDVLLARPAGWTAVHVTAADLHDLRALVPGVEAALAAATSGKQLPGPAIRQRSP